MQTTEQNIILYDINIQGEEMKIDDLSFERVIKMLQGTQSQMSMPWAWVDYSSGGEGERLLRLF